MKIMSRCFLVALIIGLMILSTKYSVSPSELIIHESLSNLSPPRLMKNSSEICTIYDIEKSSPSLTVLSSPTNNYNHISVKRNETFEFFWYYFIPDSYLENDIKIKYYLNNSFEGILLNSTDNMDLILEINQVSGYTLIHFYNDSYAFYSDCELIPDINNYVNLTVRIYFESIPVQLGMHNLTVEILTLDNVLLDIRYEEFILISDFVFEILEILVNMTQNEWVNLLALTPTVVSPSDWLVFVFSLRDEIIGTYVKQSLYYENFQLKVQMNTFTQRYNCTFFNKSDNLHTRLIPDANDTCLISIVQLPAIHYRGNFTITQEFQVVTESFNNTPVGYYSYSTNQVLIPCDYQVVADTSKTAIKDVYWVGQTLQFIIPTYPVRIYNKSLKTNINFEVSSLKLQGFWNVNKSYHMPIDINYDCLIGNRLSIEHKSFGNHKSLQPGIYFINISWGKSESIFVNNNISQTVSLNFQLKEDYSFRLRDNHLKTVNQINITDQYEPIIFYLSLYCKYTFPQDNAFRRKFVGFDSENRWEVVDVFNKTLDIHSNETILFVWVVYNNGSILQLDEVITIILTETVDSNNQSTFSIPERLIAIFGVVIFFIILGGGVFLFYIKLYKVVLKEGMKNQGVKRLKHDI